MANEILCWETFTTNQFFSSCENLSIVSVNVFWFGKKLQSAYFEKVIFYHVFNVRKTKRIAKFDDLEPRRCEDIKL